MDLVNVKDLYEASINRIIQHLDEDDVATITSFITANDDRRNVNGKALSRKANKRRNKELVRCLKDLKYSFIKVDGQYRQQDVQDVPVREESMLVVNPKGNSFEAFTKDMVNLARKFEQESVIVWNHETQTATMYSTVDYENYEDTLTFKGFTVDKAKDIAWSQFRKDWFVFGEDVDVTYEVVDVDENLDRDPNDHTKVLSVALRRRNEFGEFYY